MTTYEFNQANYRNLPTMDEEALNQSKYYIIDFLDKHKGQYYLLLNNELHYYTIFKFIEGYKPAEMAKELIDIAKDLGEIKSIEESSGGALEVWINGKDECNAYFFFKYDEGVIEI